MLFSSIFTLAILTGSAVATWTPRPQRCDISTLQLVLPTSSSTTGLAQPPPPATNILLGVGFQNYTCSSAGTYASVGALAELFDISCLSRRTTAFDNVQNTAYNQWISTSATTFNPSSIYLWTRLVGHHFFQPLSSGGLEPVWDARPYTGNPAAYVGAARVAGLASPDGAQNVDWLELQAIEGSLASLIYRTSTVGGVPPATCTSGVSPDLQLKYTAKYWYYGGSVAQL